MPLALYGHPFSSYTQKVLIALYENRIPFEFRCIGPDTPQHAAEWLRRWPLRKFPLLLDDERSVVETSIIIEYLQLAHPGPIRLLPEDPVAALDVRFLDRFFDLHVMSPVQHAVGAALTGDPVKRQDGLVFAKEKLELAYAWLETQLVGRTWAVGAEFTLADCAPDSRGVPGIACLSLSLACPSGLLAGGGGGATLSAALPLGGAGPGLTPMMRGVTTGRD